MQAHLAKRSLAASRPELDAKLELLQQLGYESRFFDGDHDVASLSEKSAYLGHDTDRWIQTEYDWALEEAAESAVSIPDLFDVEEEDEAACLPYVYDPTFFNSRQPSGPTSTRTRSQSLIQPLRTDFNKSANSRSRPLPSVPPLRLRPRPSLPIVPPSTPATSPCSSPISSQPVASPFPLADKKQPPPSSPPLSSRPSSSPKQRQYARSHASSISSSPPSRPIAQRHATYPSISSTMSLLEERDAEAEKRTAVYVSGQDPSIQPAPKLAGRGRSSSATVTRTSDELCGPFSSGSSPRRRTRPPLSTLSTSHSTPQLRTLAELATVPSPSLVPSSSTLLQSPASDATVTLDSEEVSPGEAITWSPSDDPAEGSESALASRWSLDSVASRPRIRQSVAPDVSSPASKTKKRDRLLSLISGRARAGSVGKPNAPPNTPRGSSDVLDIRRTDSRDAMQPSFFARPSISGPPLPPKVQLAPSVSSSSASSASTLATPVEPMQPSPLPEMDPFASGAPSCMFEEEPVFAENPHLIPESPLLAPERPKTPPSPRLRQQPLILDIPDRPPTPDSPPPQPTLPLPSPSTPSPSFLVPTPRSPSFFASLTGRQKRRKKKLVISGEPLELPLSRASSSLHHHHQQTTDEAVEMRALERSRRVQNVIKWCQSFGPLRKIDTKEDGSLHVYWKDWEVADMVCRVQAQVIIKDVGRVNLAWSYIS
ncbi:hypothetical protein BD414DRAFT_532153 [Trametes punicea]|nr:hypothetical protein BD414DRAFT_532153 [Trametes punicea]